MDSPKTKGEALDQCALIWGRLAETGSEHKVTAVKEVLGYMPYDGCPACEWDEINIGEPQLEESCTYCPIKGWGPLVGCTTPGEPYREWLAGRSVEERKVAAKKLLQLISESY